MDMSMGILMLVLYAVGEDHGERGESLMARIAA